MNIKWSGLKKALPSPAFLKNKYVITIFIFLLWIGIVDSNSLWQRAKMQSEKSELEERIADCKKAIKHDNDCLDRLQNDSSEIRRIARERYFMKADNEDIYILE